jgi:NAD(P)H dehydrogenase (quinone)
MVKVLVLFYSTYGHNYIMAEAVAEGVREVEGVEVDVHRVAETLPTEVLEKMHAVEAQKAYAHVPIANPKDFASYDAVIIGGPTRFGLPSAQIKTYLDALGGIWATNAAVGKVGSVWSSSATQHGGQESTILALHNTLLHLGMVVVGLPYSCADQMGIDEIKGGSPYGASTIAGGSGERLPSDVEKRMAKFQGKHVATITKQIVLGKQAIETK